MTFFKNEILNNLKRIFENYLPGIFSHIWLFSNLHTPDEKLTVEEIHRSSPWQAEHHPNFHYLVQTQFLCICPSPEYFENLWRFFYLIFQQKLYHVSARWRCSGSWLGRSAKPCRDKKNFPGFNLLPFRFQIFHNSSPSIWSHWQTIDLHRASIFPTLVTT